MSSTCCRSWSSAVAPSLTVLQLAVVHNHVSGEYPILTRSRLQGSTDVHVAICRCVAATMMNRSMLRVSEGFVERGTGMGRAPWLKSWVGLSISSRPFSISSLPTLWLQTSGALMPRISSPTRACLQVDRA